MPRGSYQFDVTEQGDLLNSAGNVELLRKLWLDRREVTGDAIGPGDAGDFDFGAWHVSCHLLGACGIRKTKTGKLVWLEISHDGSSDRYFASATVKQGSKAVTIRLDSAEGRALVAASTLVGFVEGTSLGRTSARAVADPPTLFNLWRRQDFDQPPGNAGDGGRVWEHWCTLRDIRPTSAIGTSALSAFVSLSSALGDLFTATVARGRREYGHPEQLRAMVGAGLVAEQSALWPGMPTAIPKKLELALQDADPATALQAIAAFEWSKTPRYYMFARKIAAWSKADDVKQDLAKRDGRA
jgi:hypothetical protein